METSKFDIADSLDGKEKIAEFLNIVLADGNDAEIITAIGHIAKAIGMWPYITGISNYTKESKNINPKDFFFRPKKKTWHGKKNPKTNCYI
jgi:two-component SAPR family response regulator